MELHTSLNSFDYIILGLILLSGFLALARGLVREIFSLITWAGAGIAAAKYYPLAEPWVHRYIKNPSIADKLAGVVVFCIVFIVLAVFGAIVCKFIKGKTITAIDRSLGFVFGLLRGVLVMCLIYLVATTIVWPDIDAPALTQGATQSADNAAKSEDKNPVPEWLLKARTRPFLAYGSAEMKTLISTKDLEQVSHKYLDQGAITQKLMQQNSEDLINSLASPANTPTGTTASPDDKSRDDLHYPTDQKVTP